MYAGHTGVYRCMGVYRWIGAYRCMVVCTKVLGAYRCMGCTDVGVIQTPPNPTESQTYPPEMPANYSLILYFL